MLCAIWELTEVYVAELIPIERMESTTKPIKQAVMKMDKAWFIQSRQGNIKDHYFFEKKLGSGGYGAVYLAKHKLTGMPNDKP